MSNRIEQDSSRVGVSGNGPSQTHYSPQGIPSAQQTISSQLQPTGIGRARSVSDIRDELNQNSITGFGTRLRPSSVQDPSEISDIHDRNPSKEKAFHLFRADDGKYYQISIEVQVGNGPKENCVASTQLWEEHERAFKNLCTETKNPDYAPQNLETISFQRKADERDYLIRNGVHTNDLAPADFIESYHKILTYGKKEPIKGSHNDLPTGRLSSSQQTDNIAQTNKPKPLTPEEVSNILTNAANSLDNLSPETHENFRNALEQLRQLDRIKREDLENLATDPSSNKTQNIWTNTSVTSLSKQIELFREEFENLVNDHIQLLIEASPTPENILNVRSCLQEIEGHPNFDVQKKTLEGIIDDYNKKLSETNTLLHTPTNELRGIHQKNQTSNNNYIEAAVQLIANDPFLSAACKELRPEKESIFGDTQNRLNSAIAQYRNGKSINLPSLREAFPISASKDHEQGNPALFINAVLDQIPLKSLIVVDPTKTIGKHIGIKYNYQFHKPIFSLDFKADNQGISPMQSLEEMIEYNLNEKKIVVNSKYIPDTLLFEMPQVDAKRAKVDVPLYMRHSRFENNLLVLNGFISNNTEYQQTFKSGKPAYWKLGNEITEKEYLEGAKTARLLKYCALKTKGPRTSQSSGNPAPHDPSKIGSPATPSAGNALSHPLSQSGQDSTSQVANSTAPRESSFKTFDLEKIRDNNQTSSQSPKHLTTNQQEPLNIVENHSSPKFEVNNSNIQRQKSPFKPLLHTIVEKEEIEDVDSDSLISQKSPPESEVAQLTDQEKQPPNMSSKNLFDDITKKDSSTLKKMPIAVLLNDEPEISLFGEEMPIDSDSSIVQNGLLKNRNPDASKLFETLERQNPLERESTETLFGNGYEELNFPKQKESEDSLVSKGHSNVAAARHEQKANKAALEKQRQEYRKQNTAPRKNPSPLEKQQARLQAKLQSALDNPSLKRSQELSQKFPTNKSINHTDGLVILPPSPATASTQASNNSGNPQTPAPISSPMVQISDASGSANKSKGFFSFFKREPKKPPQPVKNEPQIRNRRNAIDIDPRIGELPEKPKSNQDGILGEYMLKLQENQLPTGVFNIKLKNSNGLVATQAEIHGLEARIRKKGIQLNNLVGVGEEFKKEFEIFKKENLNKKQKKIKPHPLCTKAFEAMKQESLDDSATKPKIKPKESGSIVDSLNLQTSEKIRQARLKQKREEIPDARAHIEANGLSIIEDHIKAPPSAVQQNYGDVMNAAINELEELDDSEIEDHAKASPNAIHEDYGDVMNAAMDEIEDLEAHDPEPAISPQTQPQQGFLSRLNAAARRVVDTAGDFFDSLNGQP